jgi:AraC-like DNA-binding protein
MEWSRIRSRPDLSGLELLHAHFVRHRYARHAHEHAVIGLIDSGIQSYFYRGTRYMTGQNGIFFVNPDEAHTGESGHADGYTYRALYPNPGFLRNLFGDERTHSMHFRDAVINDVALADKLRAACIAVERDEATIACENLLLDAIVALIYRNGVCQRQPSPGQCHRARYSIRRARAIIDSNPTRNLSLSFLANEVHMSAYHLAHVFVRETGLPVHAYAETARVRLAKALLKRQVPLSDIAVRLGYSDQAHFTRRFKQLQGVTPGQYRKSATSFEPSIVPV